METSIDWSSLRDVCGSAEHIPELLRELEASHDPEILTELWDRLCHQGSVFSASFAALPDLIRIAEQWNPSERLGILSLAVSILSGENIANFRIPGQPKDSSTTTTTRINLGSPTRNRYQQEIDTLLNLIEEDLQQPNLSTMDFTYLLSNILPLKGCVLLWQDVFEYFACSEVGYYGCCVRCDAEIEVYTTDNSGIAEIITRDRQKEQTIIQPVSPESLTGILKWLYDTAKDHGFGSVAQKVTYILGSGLCPNCGTEFYIPELLKFTKIIS